MSKLPTLLVPGSFTAGGEKPAGTPIEYITAWLRARMPEFGNRDGALSNRVLVVRARTGSGKSTVLPVAVFRLLRSERTPAGVAYRGSGVICTQPRVLTALALARDIATASAPSVAGRPGERRYPDMQLGVTVGYATGAAALGGRSGLVYATAGVLAAQLRAADDAEICGAYRFIIVDEAHERSLDSDFLLLLLRAFYTRNAGDPRLPFLILTSATFDPERYARYFGVDSRNVVDVEGRAYPIAVHWPATGTNNYARSAAQVVAEIHEGHADDAPGRGDILVFMPGAAEIAEVLQLLRARNERWLADAVRRPGAGPGPVLLLQLNREIVISQAGDYTLVFAEHSTLPAVTGAAEDGQPIAAAPRRRVIVSTIVTETGLTVDTLRYVVDCGWARTPQVFAPSGATGLITTPAPRSRIEQRRGRCGRLFAGDFYPLYTENVYRALAPQQPPEIVSGGVGAALVPIMAQLARARIEAGAPATFDAADLSALLDPPPALSLVAALAAAVELGFASPRAELPRAWPPWGDADRAARSKPSAARSAAADIGPGLTRTGYIAAGFVRGGPEAARLLLAGYEHGAAAADLLTIAALFGVSGPTWALSREEMRTAEKRTGLPAGATALRSALPPWLVTRIVETSAGATGGSADDSGDDSDNRRRNRWRGAAEDPAWGAAAAETPDGYTDAAPGDVTGGAAGDNPAASVNYAAHEYYYRARLLLADDFLESLLVFDAFVRAAEDSADGDGYDIEALAGWCEARGLMLSALLALAERREHIASEAVAAGLDPARRARARLADARPADYVRRVVALKRCLHDALCPRILQWSAPRAGYYDRRGTRVKAPALLTDRAARALGITVPPPAAILTDTLRLMAARTPSGRAVEGGAPDAVPPPTPLLYAVETNLVSVLDGYVVPDPGAFCARTVAEPNN